MNNDELTTALKKYADDAVKVFDDLELPASITIFIETDDKNMQTCSLIRGHFNSLLVNTVIRDLNHLVNNVEFMQALQKAIIDN